VKSSYIRGSLVERWRSGKNGFGGFGICLPLPLYGHI
jgi:hypothetical protein